MNNLFHIIQQSWQIAKKNKLLWLFSAGSSFSGIIVYLWGKNSVTQDNTTLLCLQCISVFLFLFVLAFSTYGLIYCSGAALHNAKIKFSEVWTSFKSNIFRLFLLGIFIGIYSVVLYIVILLCRRLLTVFTGSVFSEAFLLDLVGAAIYILFGGVVFISPCGMIFQGMGPFQSFWHGMKIFSAGRISFISITLLFQISRFVVATLVSINILATGQSLNYATYQNMIGFFPYQMMTDMISFLISPVLYLSMLKIYFDLTTAKNNGENLQTVVTPKT